MLSGHDLLIVRISYELGEIDGDDILQLLVHLRNRRISPSLLLEHIVLARPLDRTVLGRVNVTQFGVGEDVLACVAVGALMVSGRVLTFMAALDDLTDDVLLLFEILVNILLAHFILIILR